MQQCCPPPRIKWRCQACEVGVGEGRVMNQNLYGDGGHLYPNGFFFLNWFWEYFQTVGVEAGVFFKT